MTVKQLIRALEKVKDKSRPVIVLDKPAKFEAEIASVDMDSDSAGLTPARVYIIIEEWPSL